MKSAIYIHKAKEGPIRRGHPWVFPKAIKKQVGTCISGELVDVFSEAGERLGVGAYNEHSLYRVRILALASEACNQGTLEEIILYRFKSALRIRENLNLPSSATTAYRMFNSEGDGLSGLTIDRFNDVLVVSSTAYWVESHKELILLCIKAVFNLNTIRWQSETKSLKQDGWNSINQPETIDKQVIIEASVRFEVDFTNTQKTGLFLDQRENHQRIAGLAKGKKVLDLYSYTGGFALHAAKAGATKVTAVDSSKDAIELAMNNAKLNEVSVDFIEKDAREYLHCASDYDIVILDPPKLVPSMRHLPKAKKYYQFLHSELFKAMRSGSLLMTCNCSSALTSTEFSMLVSLSALSVGKVVRTLGVFGPSACHPTLASFPEGQYLTALLVAVV